MACPDDVSAEAEKEPELVMGDPGPVAGAGGTVRSVGSAWRQLVPDLRGHRSLYHHSISNGILLLFVGLTYLPAVINNHLAYALYAPLEKNRN